MLAMGLMRSQKLIVESDECMIIGDPGLFDNGECEYVEGQKGILSNYVGEWAGLEGEIMSVKQNYVLYRVAHTLESMSQARITVDNLYMWADQGGIVESMELSISDGDTIDLGNGLGKAHLFHYGSNRRLKKKLVDCWEKNSPYAYVTKPNGECGLYHEPHPPTKTCKTIIPGREKVVSIADMEGPVLQSHGRPYLEGDKVRYTEPTKYIDCDVGYVPYKVGEVLETYGNGMFTLRRIRYSDVPKDGIIYMHPLEQDENFIYFHTFSTISKYHEIDNSDREPEGTMYVIDVQALKDKFGI